MKLDQSWIDLIQIILTAAVAIIVAFAGRRIVAKTEEVRVDVNSNAEKLVNANRKELDAKEAQLIVERAEAKRLLEDNVKLRIEATRKGHPT